MLMSRGPSAANAEFVTDGSLSAGFPEGNCATRGRPSPSRGRRETLAAPRQAVPSLILSPQTIMIFAPRNASERAIVPSLICAAER